MSRSMTMPEELIRAPSGAWIGPVRHPVNDSAHEAGSIHDDDAADNLGFRGGTVAGSIHLEQFPPLLDAQFDSDWIRTGTLSLYFTNAAIDREPVRASLDPDAGGKRAQIWIDREDGLRICEGTASSGADPNSALRQRLAKVRPARDIRMLKNVAVGSHCHNVPTRATQEEIDRRINWITEPRPEHTDTSVFGAIVPPLATVFHAFRAVEPALVTVEGDFVGLFGAVELHFHNGPVFVEKDYLARGEILAITDTPKTEVLWYEATLSDPATGQDIASTLHMTRLLKASSSLWA